MISRSHRLAAATAAWALVLVTGAFAQGQGTPNALQGFAVNRDQPVRIEATSLEVRDKSKVAKFLGGVKLTQGEMTMTCKTLDVHYEDSQPNTQQASAQQASAQQTSAIPGQGGSQQIRKVDALGGVRVTQKDQTATGDRGELDMRSNTVTLIGNVVITQGSNVIRGERVEVDLNSGVSRVLGKKDGRVDLLLNPNTMPGKQGEPAKDAPKDSQKKGGTGPMKLNQAPAPLAPKNRVSEKEKPQARL
jgi:lipopolysaccharide export system protein LptA